MAMMGSNRGGYRGRRHASPNAMSDINVTPLVSVSIPVDLPKTEGKNIASDKQPLVVTVTGTGDLYIQETKVEFEELGTRMQAMKGADPEMRIFVRGDKNINYGRVMEVMGALSSAGFKHVALVADMPEPDKK
jgi:biopolymer transport protein TolR